VYAQCDKLATITGRTELTTLATVDVWYRNFPGSEVTGRSIPYFRNI